MIRIPKHPWLKTVRDARGWLQRRSQNNFEFVRFTRFNDWKEGVVQLRQANLCRRYLEVDSPTRPPGGLSI